MKVLNNIWVNHILFEVNIFYHLKEVIYIYIIAIMNICQYAIMWKDRNTNHGKTRQMFSYDILKELMEGV